ncbi:MAG: tRNA (adenosine(37)-N6)-threonylcarbamoyltransferase complex transferase subunit TsaD [Proteobacteria bacterium]|nr:tRNA (adenosine(37)-N6)-threonylcarbamoyltransferase complex transferase subunit TsaD [Burkholderiales bacterium]
MLVLGIETSCDETGVALVDSERGLLAQALHSQVDLHEAYGGVVPELASRDHIRRLLPLTRSVLTEARLTRTDLDAIAYTQGPGLAGALLVGASFAHGLAYALRIPALPIHHLEGHLLSPLIAAPDLAFPFVALLVSGGHTQLMQVGGIGDYKLLGDTLDDAAGEAFDKTAKLLGLGYPGGPAIAAAARAGRPGRFRLPRPMLGSDDLDMSFSGLKTAVMTLVRAQPSTPASGGLIDSTRLPAQTVSDIAAEFQEAATDVLAAKAMAALARTGLSSLVVAGGVGANLRLREKLDSAAARRSAQVVYPPIALCTDNGAMIAWAGALRLRATRRPTDVSAQAFTVRPRWPLDTLERP